MKNRKLRCYFFGCSPFAKEFLHDNSNLEAIGFLDNDSSKWGKTYEGLPIHSPSELYSLTFDRIVIASGSIYPILLQLLELNVAEGSIEVPTKHLHLFSPLNY